MPPIFGGKSFVTRRCFIVRRGDRGAVGAACERRRRCGQLGDHLRRGVVRDGGEEIVAPEPAGRPGRVGTEHRVGVAQVTPQDRDDRLVVRIGDVAEGDEGVAPQPARVALGYVPAAVPGEQRGVVSGRGARAAAPTPAPAAAVGGRLGRATPGRHPVRAQVRRADLLAVVTAVDPVGRAPRGARGERAGLLHQPGQAAVGVDDAGGDDGAGRAAVEAAPAASTPVRHGRRGGRQGAPR